MWAKPRTSTWRQTCHSLRRCWPSCSTNSLTPNSSRRQSNCISSSSHSTKWMDRSLSITSSNHSPLSTRSSHRHLSTPFLACWWSTQSSTTSSSMRRRRNWQRLLSLSPSSLTSWRKASKWIMLRKETPMLKSLSLFTRSRDSRRWKCSSVSWVWRDWTCWRRTFPRLRPIWK